MSSSDSARIFVVAGDSGSGPEVDESEVYNDAAFAWSMADELQAEADGDGEETRYGVYELVAVGRDGQ